MFGTGKEKRWGHMQKHHNTIWQTMKKILDNEHWTKTMSDEKLTDAIRNEGVYTTPTITRDIRIKKGIGNADERRITAFAKAHKEKQKREGK